MAFVAVGMTQRSSFMPISSLEIKLEREDGKSAEGQLYVRGDEIKGNLLLNAYAHFNCFGVEIVLEGMASVEYDSGGITRKKTEKTLPYEWASIFLVGYRGNKILISVPPSRYTIPFCIPINKVDQLAGSFKGALGEIQHRIAGHVHTISIGSDRHAYKNIQLESYLNLRSMPKTAKPFSLDYFQDNSLFFKKSGFWYTLSLYQTGFVGGEPILFIMALHNLQESSVKALRVSLVKKISYFSERTTKSKFLTLDKVDINDLPSQDKWNWEDMLTVPDNTYPTTKRMIIHHQYFIRVEVQTEENEPNIMKRDIPIVIGTVREMERIQDDHLTRGRSMSLMSLESFVGSEGTMPPGYSQLSSRRTSVETLPPHYEDL